MGKLSDMMGMKPMGKMGDSESPEEDSMEDTEEPGEGPGKAGELAMKQFDRAKTPAERAQAMYDFMQACGVC